MKDYTYIPQGRHFAVRTSVWKPKAEKPAKTIGTLFENYKEVMESETK